MRRVKSIFFFFVILTMTAQVAHGELTTPSGLLPGEQFYWVFVTADTTNATSSDISDYNAFVTGTASSGTLTAAVPGAWKAIASTYDDSVSENVGVFTEPIYLLTGDLIATGTADLFDDSIANPLAVTEDGGYLTGPEDYVWTGSESNGASAEGSFLGSYTPMIGYTHLNDIRWIEGGTVYGNEYEYHVYAISEVQKVVPIPSAFWLLGSGLIGIVGIRRKFKK